MPVVIHGGGTIEGISVGGLPDSIVDADMLASNAVTAAKIVGSAVTSGSLATNVGGKIIQIVSGTPDSTHRTSTSTSFVTASSTCNVSITPTATSSKILVVCKTQVSCNDGNDGWSATIYRDSTNLGASDSGLANGNSVPGITGVYFPVSMHYVDSPNTTSSVTYQLRVCLHDLDADGGNVNVGNTTYGTSSGDIVPSLMYAMEFAS
jgi:hypothetical protein